MGFILMALIFLLMLLVWALAMEGRKTKQKLDEVEQELSRLVTRVRKLEENK